MLTLAQGKSEETAVCPDLEQLAAKYLVEVAAQYNISYLKN